MKRGFCLRMVHVNTSHPLVECWLARGDNQWPCLATLCQPSLKEFYQNSAHPIYEVELLPLFISIFLWGSWVDKSQVVCYLDNDAARSGLIKGSGATKVADAIIQLFCESEAALQLKSWFSRVPSHSNISDEPSRLKFEQLLSLGCRKATIPWMEIASKVSSRLL